MRKQSPRIDIHCHYQNYAVDKKYAHLDRSLDSYRNAYTSQLTKEVHAQQAKRIVPQNTSLEARLKDMDHMGIDIQAVSPTADHYFYWTPPEVGREIARDVNDGLAEFIAKRPDRFVGIGTLPLQQPEFAIAELERVVTKLGMRAVEVGSNINGVDLSDPTLGLDPVFARIEELDLMMFIQPRAFNGGKRFADYNLSNLIGQPLDSTVAVTHLIFDGVLERHPTLKICVAHAGGYLPFYHGRMDHGYLARADCKGEIKSKPSDYLKRLYFDCMTFDAGMLRYMVDRYGADHILLGTDYPYDMGMTDPIGLIDQVAELNEPDRDKIKGSNAARLLKIDGAE